MTSDDVIDFLGRQVARKRKCVLAGLNMHGLKVALNDEVLQRLHRLRCTYVPIDGMWTVVLCRLAGLGVRRQHRVGALDFIWPLLQKASLQGWRVYYVGSQANVLHGGLRAIAAREPGTQIRGHTGHFDHNRGSGDNVALLREIAEYRPDILLVGMGTGLQERWIAENLQSLPDVPICTVGATMEYLAGSARTPPVWVRNWGIAGLQRLVGNPRRFWHRYLVEPLALIPIVTRAFFRRQMVEVQRRDPSHM
jgi:N-acetylglucosaminyldiphosphoundecaprenol N-acetyl-beta-D-mannosaminyltransferase